MIIATSPIRATTGLRLARPVSPLDFLPLFHPPHSCPPQTYGLLYMSGWNVR